MASRPSIDDHELQVIEMNELNQLTQTVSMICLLFGGAIALSMGLDIWAQRLSHRRCRQAVRVEAESYLARYKRL